MTSELPIEAIALLDFYREIYRIAVSALRDYMLGGIVTLAGIAGFVVLPRVWAVYSAISLILFFLALSAASEKFHAILNVVR